MADEKENHEDKIAAPTLDRQRREELKEQRDFQKKQVEDAKSVLFVRQKAYQDVFKKDSQSSQAVLTDLAKFCRAGVSTFDADPRLHALQEGRREVFLRISEHLELGSEDLWNLVTRGRK